MDRTFEPIVDATASPSNSTIDTSGLAPSGMVCIAFQAPEKKGAQVQAGIGLVPGPKWTSKYPHGIRTIAAISQVRGDLTNKPQTGLNNRVGGKVGGGRGFITLEPGADYYVNVCYLDGTDPDQPDIRVQFSWG